VNSESSASSHIAQLEKQLEEALEDKSRLSEELKSAHQAIGSCPDYRACRALCYMAIIGGGMHKILCDGHRSAVNQLGTVHCPKCSHITPGVLLDQLAWYFNTHFQVRWSKFDIAHLESDLTNFATQLEKRNERISTATSNQEGKDAASNLRHGDRYLLKVNEKNKRKKKSPGAESVENFHTLAPTTCVPDHAGGATLPPYELLPTHECLMQTAGGLIPILLPGFQGLKT
jgi:hypothetical protein